MNDGIKSKKLKVWQVTVISIICSLAVVGAAVALIYNNLHVKNGLKFMLEDIRKSMRMKTGKFKPRDIISIKRKTENGKRLTKTELTGFEKFKAMLKEGSDRAIQLEKEAMEYLNNLQTKST